jgi:ProP effector
MHHRPESVKKERLKVIDWLIEFFPSAFFKQTRDIKPLKIGVFDDIIAFYDRLEAPAFSKKKLREALNYYSASPAYLTCQKTGNVRIDLYGNEVDLVTEDQARYAHKRLQERQEQRKKFTRDEPLADN